MKLLSFYYILSTKKWQFVSKYLKFLEECLAHGEDSISVSSLPIKNLQCGVCLETAGGFVALSQYRDAQEHSCGDLHCGSPPGVGGALEKHKRKGLPSAKQLEAPLHQRHETGRFRAAGTDPVDTASLQQSVSPRLKK